MPSAAGGDDAASRAAADEEEPQPPSFARLLSFAAPEAAPILAGLLSLVVRLPFCLAMPHFVSEALAAVLSRDEAAAEAATIKFFVAALINGVSDFGNWFFFVVAQQRLVRRLRTALFVSILRQDMAYFDSAASGALASRLNSDCGQLSNDLTWVFRWSLEALLRTAGVSAYLFWASPRLGALAMFLVPATTAANRVYGRWVQANAQRVQTATAAASEVAQDAIGAIRTVAAFGGEAYEAGRYRRCVQATYALNIRQGVLDGLYFSAISSFLMGCLLQGAFLAYGCRLVMAGSLRGERFIAVMFYQGQLSSNFQSLLDTFSSLCKSSGASAKVFQLLDRKPAFDRSAGDAAPASLEGRVTFAAVRFAYPTRPGTPVLRSLSFSAEPGRVTALVGPSGAGKTTVFHLLQRFYEPQEGAVMLDGVGVSALSHVMLHSAVGLVAQEPLLFRCSIGENIGYGRAAAEAAARGGCGRRGEGRGSAAPRGEARDAPTAAGMSVEAAACMANADGFIRALPDGYATDVGERGVQLSGGQRQRVAIARAVHHNPRVLLLDEATSALDTESEAAVQDALRVAMAHRTVLVIAHRMSTVASADRICVLNSGLLVEQGSHSDLMVRPRNQPGVALSYRTLVEGDLLRSS